MVVIKLKWGKEEYDVEIEDDHTVEVFKTQVWTMTNVPVDRQKYLGFPGGMLKDSDDLPAKAAKLKAGAKVTLMGTAEGGELKAPEQKTVFDEDLTPDERAKILKERKVEVLPAGIKNLGNTCYMNSVLQVLFNVKELGTAIQNYAGPAAGERDIDAVLTTQYGVVSRQITSTTDAIVPLQFVMALRQRFPTFAEQGQGGAYKQQDADECLRGLLSVFASTLGASKIDDVFAYKMKSTLKCLECDEEPVQDSEESSRVMMCHLGTATDPVSHIHMGIMLSLKEHIEKNSAFLDRNAQYEKTSKFDSMPPVLVVQFARFGYKAANEWAGTAASKVKLVKRLPFSKNFDLYDFATDELKAKLQVGRLKQKEKDDADLVKFKASLDQGGASSSDAKAAGGGDVEMKDAEDASMKVMGEEYDTGVYELVGIVSHKGRTADGGHYVGWTLWEKADGKKAGGNGLKEDRWMCYDDEDVSCHDYKDIMGLNCDLQGGKADTQIAYINIYKKVTVVTDGQVLGSKDDASAAEGGGADAPAAA